MQYLNFRKYLCTAAAVSTILVGTAALADPRQDPCGPGCYGMASGMMGGYGPGYGMGPGMMEGYGPGYGMGPGMMGGYGPGHDLNLSAEQRGKIASIQADIRRKHWDLMGKIQEEQLQMTEQYNAEKREDAALSASHRKISELRQQMFDLSLNAQKQMDAVLTKEQRDKLRRGR